MAFRISHSAFANWQRCKRLYYYTEKLNLEPKKKALPLIRGTLMHALVEAEFPKQVFDLQAEILRIAFPKDDDVETMLLSVWAAFEEWQLEPPLMDMTETEYYIEYKITHNIVFEGQVDGYGETLRGNKAVYELKTKQTRSNLDQISERFRPQAVLYAAALRAMGIPITHMVREFIYVPNVQLPVLIKNGTMSKANINCTWTLYRNELKKNKLDPRQYYDMKTKLSKKVREHLVTPVTDYMVDTFKASIVSEAYQILKEKMFPRSWAYDCSRCPFKEPCFLGLADPEGERETLDKFFQTRESHYAKDKKASSTG